MELKTVLITQARTGSTRLPGKVLMEINKTPLLKIHLDRLKKSKNIDKIIVATTDCTEDNIIEKLARDWGYEVFRGSENDVLDRFYQAVKKINPLWVVRVTSDCPLIDPELIDKTIHFTKRNNLKYYSNQLNNCYPDGFDVEVFTFDALKDAYENAILKSDREHVTPFIRRKYNTKFILSDDELEFKYKYSTLRVTVDESADLELIKELLNKLGGNKVWKEYSDHLLENSNLINLNSKLLKNYGYMKSKFEEIELRNITNFTNSNEYRKKIHNLIPGGAHTYSKGDDQFPLLSPAAISHGKGPYVWDIDNNKYLDCSMGLTSVSLGHAFDPVLDEVKLELEKGVNFQRPSVLEKETAENFLSLVPGHDMVKFAKNGSIVTTAAVKLARAKTNRKLVAFPGDHPFYSYDDWFIGSTPCNKGVPEEISELSVTFNSCNIESVIDLFKKYPNQIACIITEPEKPLCGNGCLCKQNSHDYLHKLLEICHENGALLILDEMVTGFKTAFPGSMTKYNIVPDMATWGKGISNGFSFCALTGKKEIMELGGINRTGEEKVFLISTTHGGETHAMAAANATIDFFRNNNVIVNIHNKNKRLIEICDFIIKEYDLSNYIQLIPSNWYPIFVFKNKDFQISNEYKTLFQQEMIKRGVLFQGAFISTYTLTEDDIHYFAKAFEMSSIIYKQAIDLGVKNFLIGEPTKPVFRKYL